MSLLEITQTLAIIGVMLWGATGHRTHKRHDQEMAAREKVIQAQRDEIKSLQGMYAAIMGMDPKRPLKVEHSGEIEVEHKKEAD